MVQMQQCVCVLVRVLVCVYPQCAQATESFQHAVMHIFQSIGGQNELVDPRSSFESALLDVSDAVITQVTCGGGAEEEQRKHTSQVRHLRAQTGAIQLPFKNDEEVSLRKDVCFLFMTRTGLLHGYYAPVRLATCPTHIFLRWGNFLKIPVASRTVNSLLFRRLRGKRERERERQEGDEG